jgi:solute carrier family 25 S-adenosylmethionine transporter 26
MASVFPFFAAVLLLVSTSVHLVKVPSDDGRSSSSTSPTSSEEVFAGTAATVVCGTALYPLNTMKTRLQTKSSSSSSSCKVKHGGLYRGYGVAMLGTLPSYCLFFTAYPHLKSLTNEILLPSTPSSSKHPSECSNLCANVVAATGAELIAGLVRGPTEVVKQRLQAGVYCSKTTLIEVLRSIYHTQGLGGFYRGYVALSCRNIPFSLVYFPLFEECKAQLAVSRKNSRGDGQGGGAHISPLDSATCGAVVGGVAAVITCPFDLTLTRVINSSSGGSGDTTKSSKAKKLGVLGTMIGVVREEGFFCLFRGCGPRVLWVSASRFTFFGVYGEILNLLNCCDHKQSGELPEHHGDKGLVRGGKILAGQAL